VKAGLDLLTYSFVVVRITDTGRVNSPEAIKERIIEDHFLPPKPPAKAAIGDWISERRFIEKHQGTNEVKARPGKTPL
jgi:hypothetical protein